MSLFFKSHAEKEADRQKDLMASLARIKKILDTMSDKGLLSYDPIRHRLFISTVLSNIYLQSEHAWGAFLNNVYNWALYNRQQEAWNAYFQKVEIAAVREAQKKYAALTKADVQRIRHEARMKVDVSAIEAPAVEAFEFFITDMTADEEPILAVGKYDGHHFEMARYEEVRRFLQKEKK